MSGLLGFGGMDGAALCAVGCEIPALWPTLREASRRPEQESLLSWSVDVVGHSLALAAVARVSLAALAYPVYAVAATLGVSAVLVLGRVRRTQTVADVAAVEAPIDSAPRVRIMSRPHRR